MAWVRKAVLAAVPPQAAWIVDGVEKEGDRLVERRAKVRLIEESPAALPRQMRNRDHEHDGEVGVPGGGGAPHRLVRQAAVGVHAGERRAERRKATLLRAGVAGELAPHHRDDFREQPVIGR